MINPFEFVLPTKIRYGAGIIKVLGEELRLLEAKKVMVITDKGLVKAGMVKKVTEIIEAEGMAFIIYDEIEANPKDYNVEACAEKARAEAIDTVLAFGGGSPIDAAKATVALARQGGRVRNYQGKGKIKDDCLPLITIPTTAGTGSEVTFSSVITDTKEKFKFTIKSTAIAAKTAIIDPELTLTVPPLITAATGIDALTHAIEGYMANCTEPIAEAAVKGIEHIRKLSKEIGLPGIRSLNINTDDFELLAEMSEKNSSNDSNPRKITKDEYVALFYKAYNDCD